VEEFARLSGHLSRVAAGWTPPTPWRWAGVPACGGRARLPRGATSRRPQRAADRIETEAWVQLSDADEDAYRTAVATATSWRAAGRLLSPRHVQAKAERLAGDIVEEAAQDGMKSSCSRTSWRPGTVPTDARSSSARSSAPCAERQRLRRRLWWEGRFTPFCCRRSSRAWHQHSGCLCEFLYKKKKKKKKTKKKKKK
jgi:hypothetical protein